MGYSIVKSDPLKRSLLDIATVGIVYMGEKAMVVENLLDAILKISSGPPVDPSLN